MPVGPDLSYAELEALVVRLRAEKYDVLHTLRDLVQGCEDCDFRCMALGPAYEMLRRYGSTPPRSAA